MKRMLKKLIGGFVALASVITMMPAMALADVGEWNLYDNCEVHEYLGTINPYDNSIYFSYPADNNPESEDYTVDIYVNTYEYYIYDRDEAGRVITCNEHYVLSNEEKKLKLLLSDVEAKVDGKLTTISLPDNIREQICNYDFGEEYVDTPYSISASKQDYNKEAALHSDYIRVGFVIRNSEESDITELPEETEGNIIYRADGYFGNDITLVTSRKTIENVIERPLQSTPSTYYGSYDSVYLVKGLSLYVHELLSNEDSIPAAKIDNYFPITWNIYDPKTYDLAKSLTLTKDMCRIEEKIDDVENLEPHTKAYSANVYYDLTDADVEGLEFKKLYLLEQKLATDSATDIESGKLSHTDFAIFFPHGGYDPGNGGAGNIDDKDKPSEEKIISEEVKKQVAEQNQKREDALKTGKTNQNPVTVEVKQSENDTVNVVEQYIKGKVKARKISVSNNNAAENIVTVNAGTKYQIDDYTANSIKIVSDTLGGVKSNQRKSTSAAASQKGDVSVKAIKDRSNYSFVVTYKNKNGEDRALTFKVENIAFNKNIKKKVLNSTKPNEAYTVSITDAVSTSRETEIISGMWSVSNGVKYNSDGSVKSADKKFADYEISKDGTSVKIIPVAGKKGNVKITVVINGKKYTTSVKIVNK